MSPAAVIDLVARFLEDVWNKGDVAAVDRYIADAYTIRHDPHDPWDGKTLDRAGYRERLAVSRAPFPDQRFDIIDAAALDDRVATAWLWKGTHLGDLPGFPASRRLITMSGITFYYVEGARLTGHRQEIDRLGVFRQLTAKG